jgi:hypothetical protein
MKVHAAITTVLAGAVSALIFYANIESKEKELQQKDIMLLQETVINMSQMVLVQGIQIEVLQEKIAKFSGTRVTY